MTKNNRITAGTAQLSVTIPTDVDDIENYILQLITQENDAFNSNIKNIKINIKNKDTITVNTSKAESSTNTHTLEQALQLVKNFGIIDIETQVTEEDIVIDKNITIRGNSIANTNIVNNASEVLIQSIEFVNSPIINNKQLLVDECSFKNTTTSCITNNDELTLYKSLFENNEADYGACINITNKNISTIIDECTFRNNIASQYGGCIFSQKGNDIEITKCEFSKNKATYNGSSISIYGNADISDNTFYNNNGNNEIYLMKGYIDMDRNVFDGKINAILIMDGQIDADLNYWGYNDESHIQALEENNNIIINNYLISHCEVEKHEDKKYAVGIINQYRNRLEIETTTISFIESTLPVMIGNVVSSLNKREIVVQNNSKMKIGQVQVDVIV